MPVKITLHNVNMLRVDVQLLQDESWIQQMMNIKLQMLPSIFIISFLVICGCEVCNCFSSPETDQNDKFSIENIGKRQIDNSSGTISSNTTNSTNAFPNNSSNMNTTQSNETENTTEEPADEHQLIAFNWLRVSAPYIICLWMIFAGLAKISLQFIPKLVSRVPESCILICLGLIVGGMFYAINSSNALSSFLFKTDAFFLYILPPIVMEAGYFIPKRPLLGNIGTILGYAVFGTIFNITAIGSSLYAVYQAGLMPDLDLIGPLRVLDCFLFGTIISAVDPVAIISVFEEIHVNTVLYICVFAESLFNDGVVVVLYNISLDFVKIGEENITGIDVFYIFLSFIIVVSGALFIGIFFGYLCSFITKYTVNNQIIEPTLVFSFCYLSYLTAEIFHISGILAMVVSAISMSSYVERNISEQSLVTVKYAMKMLANIAETIIFMVLGISTVSDFWESWNTGFVLWTLLFCLVYRPIGVFVLTKIANSFRIEKINRVDQFVMAYGGLRGAIAFALVSVVSKEDVPTINTMVCACIIVILFTSFVQGATIRPIVELLNVKTTQTHVKTLLEDISSRLIDHIMAGIEDVIGHHGHHYWMQRLSDLHYKYVAKYFTRQPFKTRDEKIFETFHRINKRDAEGLVMELEKGSSSGDLRQAFTLTTLLFPLEPKSSRSSSSQMRRSRTTGILDMHKRPEAGKEPIITHEAGLHHLLQQNMYQTRKIERTRYRRGAIDEDSDAKRQEEEILMRRRLSLTKKKRRHHKHKHLKKGHSFRSPTLKKHAGSTSSVPIFHQTFQGAYDGPHFRAPISTDDLGITFKASSHAGSRAPLGFVSEFEPLKEEDYTTSSSNRVSSADNDADSANSSPKDAESVQSSRGPLSFMNALEPLAEEEVSELEDKRSNVAIDRELPWKRISNDTVYDPHATETELKVPQVDGHRRGSKDRFSPTH